MAVWATGKVEKRDDADPNEVDHCKGEAVAFRMHFRRGVRNEEGGIEARCHGGENGEEMNKRDMEKVVEERDPPKQRDAVRDPACPPFKKGQHGNGGADCHQQIEK